jgi:Cap4 SAVED domain
MALFDKWCTSTEDGTNRKRLWKLSERPNGRNAVRVELGQRVRAHYDRLDRIADDVAALGYAGAAEILREILPRTKKARSGDLGEILASELVEERMDFNIPVRRMRYKDGREVPLRGDDFIGVGHDDEDRLRLLKGEAKSRRALGKTTITEARAALNRDDGRCTPSSLLFVANQLLERDGDDAELGRAIRNEVALRGLQPNRIDHVLFTMSGNAPPGALQEDLDAAGPGRNHTVVNLRIEDHQEFIGETYQEAGHLGND